MSRNRTLSQAQLKRMAKRTASETPADVRVKKIVGAKPIPPATREQNRIGRNEPCPCGSGRKFKRCHGKEAP